MDILDTFQVGDLVVWNSDHPMTHFLNLVEKYGLGPFRITKVIPVPENFCSCGMALNHPYHDDFCLEKELEKDLLEDGLTDHLRRPQTMRQSVGHHQLVAIEVLEEILEFSGVYFKKLVEPS